MFPYGRKLKHDVKMDLPLSCGIQLSKLTKTMKMKYQEMKKFNEEMKEEVREMKKIIQKLIESK